jgi:opacity protein-like surface antigen
MTRLLKASLLTTISLVCSQAYSSQLPGHFLLEAGGFYSTQGKSQFIGINGLVGDQFNVTKRHDENFLVGAGFLFNGYRYCQYGIDYGINAFYLPNTQVKGTITQELLFTNLAYRYDVSHLPVYLFAKGFMNTNYLAITLDAGIGPNFMKTDMHGDTSLDGITLPDDAFTGSNSTTVFSAMAGIGVKFNVCQVPLEVGYRYFYLGEGRFNARSDQISNKLKTGTCSAQALMLTLYL